MPGSADKPQGFVPLEWMEPIEVGMSDVEILSRLGEPYEKLSPEDVSTPSDFFASIGSIFRPTDDEGVEEIWTYRHDSYPEVPGETKQTSFLGFADHELQSFWQHDQKTK